MALAKRDRKASVALHEEKIENYLQSLNKIIQRDSFPELSKLREQHKCLDAVKHTDLEKQREISARCEASRTPSGNNKYGCSTSGLEDFRSNILWTHSSPYIKDYRSLFLKTTPSASAYPDTSSIMTLGSKEETSFCWDSGLYTPTGMATAITYCPVEGIPSSLMGHDKPITGTPGSSFQMLEPKKQDQLDLVHAENFSSLLAKTSAPISVSSKYIRPGQTYSAARRLQELGIRTGAGESLSRRYYPAGMATAITYCPDKGIPSSLIGRDTPITGTPGSSFQMLKLKKRDQLRVVYEGNYSSLLAKTSVPISVRPNFISSHQRYSQLKGLTQRRMEADVYLFWSFYEAITLPILLVFVLIIKYILYDLLYKQISSRLKKKKS